MKVKKFNFSKNYYYIALFINLTIILYIALMSSDEYIKRLVIDDALYYPIVARNIAIGNGSTFDQITKTNGYHPLWCFINVPFMALSSDNMIRLYIFKFIIVITVTLMLLVWDKLLKILNFNYLSRGFFLLLMGSTYWWSIKVYYSGMEISLVSLFLGILLIQFIRLTESNTIKNQVYFGIVVALTFLSRLDVIFVIFSVFIFWFLVIRTLKDKILSLMIAFIISLPYLLSNLFYFGHIVPVSGRKKSFDDITMAIKHNIMSFSKFIENEIFRINKILPIEIFLVSLFFLIVIVSIIIIRNYNQLKIFFSGSGKYLLPIFAGTLLHFLYNIIIMSEITVDWYQYLIYLSIFIFITTIINFSQKWIAYSIYLISLFSVIFQIVIAINKEPQQIKIKTIEAATFVKNNFNHNSIFLMHDPGVFAFISERKTIAKNGLIGDNKVLEFVKYYNVLSLIDHYKIDYACDIFYVDKIRAKNISGFIYKTENFLYGRDSAFIGIAPAKKLYKDLYQKKYF